MRTTVTLDREAAQMLREAMHRSRNGFKKTLNAAVPAGLYQNTAPAVSRPFAIQALTAETPMAALVLGNGNGVRRRFPNLTQSGVSYRSSIPRQEPVQVV